ncbi:MAG: transporter substrate-binding protein [Naasia sp.]|jgi:putative multiple sugar transport system substrate-binding protein|uniref:substrate-binding domain-containing protein n=1 Tax=Naasia sp. TaxID=2546198 RepID=UPI00262F6C6E|nr:sugar-binding protein [Naasia sp.]MCU1570536.1 transporter substrate-binding protein [Naasia sp.]
MAINKKIAAVAAAAALALTMSACASGGGGSTGGGSTDGSQASADCNVGIAMPTRSLERWIGDGEGLQQLLKDQGCTTDLQYADNKTDQQISQIQNMIAGGAKYLVITAIDSATLGQVLSEAKDAGVKVIAFDRLITGSDAVTYHAGFDNYAVGEAQGKFIEEQLGLKDGKGPFNFEPFAGSPDDNNAGQFFAGAWDILLPYVESGKLVVKSGKAPKSNDEWTSIGILGWGSDDAQAEMENRLASFYAGGDKVDAVLSPNDSLALGIEAAFTGADYKVGQDWPIITGQDGDKANVKAILNGQQAMTVWKDTRELRKRVALMIQQDLAGDKVETNTTFDNGKVEVPSFGLPVEAVTKDLVQEKLIDSGFLKAADVGL